MYMPSTRTQIYLSKEQRRWLDARRKREGKSLAAVVRDAIDSYIGGPSDDAQRVLDESFGALPDLEVPSRREDWANRQHKLKLRG
jgi:hypothetical protein